MSTILSETRGNARNEASWSFMPRWLDRIGLPLLLAGSLSTIFAAALV